MPGPLVVITGASSGIGLALARTFAREGNALLLIAATCNRWRICPPPAPSTPQPTSLTMVRWSAQSAMPSSDLARPLA
jgi:NAD(P)-dependent dehydrogenase (short-subunit alcohol dehydrogenase family)